MGGGELCYDRCDKWAPNPPLWSYKIVIAFCLISSNHRESKVEKCRKYSTQKNYPIRKNVEKRNVLVLHIAWFFPSFLPLKKKKKISMLLSLVLPFCLFLHDKYDNLYQWTFYNEVALFEWDTISIIRRTAIKKHTSLQSQHR